MNVVVYNTQSNTSHRYSLVTDGVDEVKAHLGADPSILVEKGHMRLIANGKELEDSDSLLCCLGEFYFKKNALVLVPLDATACREWQRSGRCSNCKCELKSSHTVGLSPRYIQHQLADTPPSTPPLSPDLTTSEAPAPVLRPHEKPEVCCRNWAAHGSCRFGQKCHYVKSHTQSNLPGSQKVPAVVRPVHNNNSSWTGHQQQHNTQYDPVAHQYRHHHQQQPVFQYPPVQYPPPEFLNQQGLHAAFHATDPWGTAHA